MPLSCTGEISCHDPASTGTRSGVNFATAVITFLDTDGDGDFDAADAMKMAGGAKIDVTEEDAGDEEERELLKTIDMHKVGFGKIIKDMAFVYMDPDDEAGVEGAAKLEEWFWQVPSTR